MSQPPYALRHQFWNRTTRRRLFDSTVMRVRKPFAGGFAGLVVFAGYVGLAPIRLPTAAYQNSDKVLHVFTFILLTVIFYWIFETSRRRAIQLTFLVCTVAFGIGSEVVQGAIPNGRDFDYLDIVANIFGSLIGLGLCSWYHVRMLERKRAAKGYVNIAGDEESGMAGVEDVELGERTGVQESSVTTAGQRETTIDEDLDNWDENAADDWDEDAPNTKGTAKDSTTVK